jgi:hypothetical protein
MIRVDLAAFTRSAKKMDQKDWPKHVVNGFAELADVSAGAVRVVTRGKFKLHSDYIPKGIKSTPMTSSQKARAEHALRKYGDFNAAVFLRGSRSVKHSLDFMADHEEGDPRKPQKSYIAIPTTQLKEKRHRSPRGATRKRWKPETLLERYNATGGSFNGTTTTNKGKRLGPRKKRMPGDAFLIMGKQGDPFIARRMNRNKNTKHGGELEFLYVLKNEADIKSGWQFVTTVYSTVGRRYATILHKHIKRIPDYG